MKIIVHKLLKEFKYSKKEQVIKKSNKSNKEEPKSVLSKDADKGSFLDCRI